MKTLKLTFLIFILFIIYIFLSAKSYSTYVFNDLSDEIFRFHIVANSNSSEDQYLKLKIRDNILSYINKFIDDETTKSDIISFINSHKNKIDSIIKSTIQKNSYTYNYSFNIEKCYFPTKNYGNISLPEGIYDCLNIRIGSSEGENWLCVMFPPLCISDSELIMDNNSKELLLKNISSESYDIINSKKGEYKIKFKILEIFSSFNS